MKDEFIKQILVKQNQTVSTTRERGKLSLHSLNCLIFKGLQEFVLNHENFTRETNIYLTYSGMKNTDFETL